MRPSAFDAESPRSNTDEPELHTRSSSPGIQRPTVNTSHVAAANATGIRNLMRPNALILPDPDDVKNDPDDVPQSVLAPLGPLSNTRLAAMWDKGNKGPVQFRLPHEGGLASGLSSRRGSEELTRNDSQDAASPRPKTRMTFADEDDYSDEENEDRAFFRQRIGSPKFRISYAFILTFLLISALVVAFPYLINSMYRSMRLEAEAQAGGSSVIHVASQWAVLVAELQRRSFSVARFQWGMEHLALERTTAAFSVSGLLCRTTAAQVLSVTTIPVRNTSDNQLCMRQAARTVSRYFPENFTREGFNVSATSVLACNDDCSNQLWPSTLASNLTADVIRREVQRVLPAVNFSSETDAQAAESVHQAKKDQNALRFAAPIVASKQTLVALLYEQVFMLFAIEPSAMFRILFSYDHESQISAPNDPDVVLRHHSDQSTQDQIVQPLRKTKAHVVLDERDAARHQNGPYDIADVEVVASTEATTKQELIAKTAVIASEYMKACHNNKRVPMLRLPFQIIKDDAQSGEYRLDLRAPDNSVLFERQSFWEDVQYNEAIAVCAEVCQVSGTPDPNEPCPVSMSGRLYVMAQASYLVDTSDMMNSFVGVLGWLSMLGNVILHLILYCSIAVPVHYLRHRALNTILDKGQPRFTRMRHMLLVATRSLWIGELKQLARTQFALLHLYEEQRKFLPEPIRRKQAQTNLNELMDQVEEEHHAMITGDGQLPLEASVTGLSSKAAQAGQAAGDATATQLFPDNGLSERQHTEDFLARDTSRGGFNEAGSGVFGNLGPVLVTQGVSTTVDPTATVDDTASSQSKGYDRRRSVDPVRSSTDAVGAAVASNATTGSRLGRQSSSSTRPSASSATADPKRPASGERGSGRIAAALSRISLERESARPHRPGSPPPTVVVVPAVPDVRSSRESVGAAAGGVIVDQDYSAVGDSASPGHSPPPRRTTLHPYQDTEMSEMCEVNFSSMGPTGYAQANEQAIAAGDLRITEHAALLVLSFGFLEEAYAEHAAQAGSAHRKIFAEVFSVVRRYRGDPFIRTAKTIAVAWNAFEACNSPVQVAVQCAVELHDRLVAPLRLRGFKIGLAVHVGPAVCGFIGDDEIMCGVLFGHALTTTISLAELHQNLREASMLITDPVRVAVSIFFKCVLVDVVGTRDEAGNPNGAMTTNVFDVRPLAADADADREAFVVPYTTAFAMFRQHDFTGALEVLTPVLNETLLDQVELMQARRLLRLCRHYSHTPEAQTVKPYIRFFPEWTMYERCALEHLAAIAAAAVAAPGGESMQGQCRGFIGALSKKQSSSCLYPAPPSEVPRTPGSAMLDAATNSVDAVVGSCAIDLQESGMAPESTISLLKTPWSKHGKSPFVGPSTKETFKTELEQAVQRHRRVGSSGGSSNGDAEPSPPVVQASPYQKSPTRKPSPSRGLGSTPFSLMSASPNFAIGGTPKDSKSTPKSTHLSAALPASLLRTNDSVRTGPRSVYFSPLEGPGSTTTNARPLDDDDEPEEEITFPPAINNNASTDHAGRSHSQYSSGSHHAVAIATAAGEDAPPQTVSELCMIDGTTAEDMNCFNEETGCDVVQMLLPVASESAFEPPYLRHIASKDTASTGSLIQEGGLVTSSSQAIPAIPGLVTRSVIKREGSSPMSTVTSASSHGHSATFEQHSKRSGSASTPSSFTRPGTGASGTGSGRIEKLRPADLSESSSRALAPPVTSNAETAEGSMDGASAPSSAVEPGTPAGWFERASVSPRAAPVLPSRRHVDPMSTGGMLPPLAPLHKEDSVNSEFGQREQSSSSVKSGNESGSRRFGSSSAQPNNQGSLMQGVSEHDDDDRNEECGMSDRYATSDGTRSHNAERSPSLCGMRRANTDSSAPPPISPLVVQVGTPALSGAGTSAPGTTIGRAPHGFEHVEGEVQSPGTEQHVASPDRVVLPDIAMAARQSSNDSDTAAAPPRGLTGTPPPPPASLNPYLVSRTPISSPDRKSARKKTDVDDELEIAAGLTNVTSEEIEPLMVRQHTAPPVVTEPPPLICDTTICGPEAGLSTPMYRRGLSSIAGTPIKSPQHSPDRSTGRQHEEDDDADDCDRDHERSVRSRPPLPELLPRNSDAQPIEGPGDGGASPSLNAARRPRAFGRAAGAPPPHPQSHSRQMVAESLMHWGGQSSTTRIRMSAGVPIPAWSSVTGSFQQGQNMSMGGVRGSSGSGMASTLQGQRMPPSAAASIDATGAPNRSVDVFRSTATVMPFDGPFSSSQSGQDRSGQGTPESAPTEQTSPVPPMPSLVMSVSGTTPSMTHATSPLMPRQTTMTSFQQTLTSTNGGFVGIPAPDVAGGMPPDLMSSTTGFPPGQPFELIPEGKLTEDEYSYMAATWNNQQQAQAQAQAQAAVHAAALEQQRQEEETLPVSFVSNTGAVYQRSAKLIGRGSYGVVYLGMEEHSGRLVALKFMPVPTDADAIESVANEVSIMEKVRDANVVDYYGFAIVDKSIVLIMECVVAGSLHSLLQSFSQMPQVTTVNFMRNILHGLHKLHAMGIMHRDVKPQNVLVTTNGQCKLTDFGASAMLSALARDGIGVGGEGKGGVMGTPLYLSPEAARGQATFKSDIWAVGIMFLQLTTGDVPYELEAENGGIDIVGFVKAVGDGSLTPQYDPAALSAVARGFVAACLRPEPERRPSADELLQMPFFLV